MRRSTSTNTTPSTAATPRQPTVRGEPQPSAMARMNAKQSANSAPEAAREKRGPHALGIAGDERKDEGEKRARKGPGPAQADAPAARRVRLLDFGERHRDRADADRDVDEEDRLPADAVGQHAADE